MLRRGTARLVQGIRRRSGLLLPLLGGVQRFQLGLHLLHGVTGLCGFLGGGGIFPAAHQAADPGIILLFKTHDGPHFPTGAV